MLNEYMCNIFDLLMIIMAYTERQDSSDILYFIDRRSLNMSTF